MPPSASIRIQESRYGVVDKTARRFRRGRRRQRALILRKGVREREADDQGAAALEQPAAIEDEGGVHCALLLSAGTSSAVSISRAARCTARRMRIWVPHRHRCGASSARICSSVGLEFRLQQRLRAHHHARDAIAALRRLLFHEGALDRRRLRSGSEPLQRRHLLALQQHHRRHAGQYRLAVDDHRAGTALAEPAAELRGVEFQIVPQHIEQRRIRFRFDLVIPTIDLQCHHRLSRCDGSAGALRAPAEVSR